MRKLAVIDKFLEPRLHVYEAALRDLGEEAVLYCRADYWEIHREALEKLRRAGVEVLVDQYERAAAHDCYLMDVMIYCYQGGPLQRLDAETSVLFTKLKDRGARFILWPHGSDTVFPSTSFRDRDFVLCSSDLALFETVADGRFLCDSTGPLVGRTTGGTECAVIGLVHSQYCKCFEFPHF